MRGNPRRMGKKLFSAVPHPRRERAGTQGIMTKTGDTLVGEQRSARALCSCLTWPQVGEHSLNRVIGPGGRGWRYLTAGSRQTWRKGDTVWSSGFQLQGGRQAGGQGSRQGVGRGGARP